MIDRGDGRIITSFSSKSNAIGRRDPSCDTSCLSCILRLNGKSFRFQRAKLRGKNYVIKSQPAPQRRECKKHFRFSPRQWGIFFLSPFVDSISTLSFASRVHTKGEQKKNIRCQVRMKNPVECSVLFRSQPPRTSALAGERMINDVLSTELC